MTFSEEAWLLLIGAGIGLVSSMIGAVVQHLLSLRADRKKAEMQRKRRLEEVGIARVDLGRAVVSFDDGHDFSDAEIGPVKGRDVQKKEEEPEPALEEEPDKR